MARRETSAVAATITYCKKKTNVTGGEKTVDTFESR